MRLYNFLVMLLAAELVPVRPPGLAGVVRGAQAD